jgi:hypothetical protein
VHETYMLGREPELDLEREDRRVISPRCFGE